MTKIPHPEEEDLSPDALHEIVLEVDEDRRRADRIKWTVFWVAMLGLVLGGTALAVTLAERDDARGAVASEQQQKVEIASEAQKALCKAGDVAVYDDALCAQLEAIANDEPVPDSGPIGPRGEKGDKGDKGDRGAPGAAGAAGADGTDGEPGSAGADGTNGTAGDPGVPGAPGSPGESVLGPVGPEGPPGPPGADSTIPGPVGSTGPQGISITRISCEGTGNESFWSIEYSDGSTGSTPGPCRLDQVWLPSPEPGVTQP